MRISNHIKITPPSKAYSLLGSSNIIEEPKKATQRGVNESQSKFFEGIWLISQNKSNTPLFYLSQDHIAIGKLLTLGTGLGNTNHSRR
jgi:hypothetical protein